MSDRPLRLCLACQHFYPIHGGGTLRFLRYFPGLRRRGIHAQVVTGTPKASKLIDTEYTRDWNRYAIGETIPAEPIDSTPIHRIRLPEKKGWRRLIVFNKEIMQLCQQPDFRPHIVQLFQSLPHRSIPWLKRIRRCGVAISYAYTSPAKLPQNPLKRMIRRWAMHELSRNLECIIVGSTSMANHARWMGLKGRIEVIPNGVDLQRFHPDGNDKKCQALRDSLGISKQSIVISTVGSVIPRKGSDLLLEAWASLAWRFPQCHLMIVGTRFNPNHSEKGEFEQKIESLLAASGASDRVHFPGYVDDIELYLRASDIFVFTPLKEGVPNVVLEAMASGLPVVLAPFPTLSEEFGRSGREYLLVDRTPEAITSSVTQLIQDERLRSVLGRQGHRWVQKTMDLEKILDRYAGLYHDLAQL